MAMACDKDHRRPVTGRNESAMPNKSRHKGTQQMAEFKPGSMDIKAQEKTFAGFLRMVTWGAGISIAVLIFLALANA